MQSVNKYTVDGTFYSGETKHKSIINRAEYLRDWIDLDISYRADTEPTCCYSRVAIASNDILIAFVILLNNPS